MSITWQFDETDCGQSSAYRPIAPVKYWVKIENAEETVGKTGQQMIKLTLGVGGEKGKVWFYIVFDARNKAMVNKKLGEIYDSFKIPRGDLNVSHWIGRVGAGQLKQDSYEGQPIAHVSYFLDQGQQLRLPPWQDLN